MTPEQGVGLTTSDRLKLTLGAYLYKMSRAIGLDTLSNLFRSVNLTLDAAVWLLGECYSAHSAADGQEQEEVRSGR